MKSRPWPILILGAIHILNPFYSFVFLAWLSQQDPGFMLSRLQSPWQFFEFWLLFPLAGVAIIAMRRWSYPIILFVWLYNFYTSYAAWSQNPETVTLPILIANYLLSITILGYFLIPNVRAVYYNPRLRWWEQKPRFYYELPCTVRLGEESFEGLVLDLAEGGLFITTNESLSLNQTISISFPVEQSQVTLGGEVVHRGQNEQKNGYGIRFLEIDSKQKEILFPFLRELEKSGIPQREARTITRQTFMNWLKNLFTTGKGVIPELPFRRND